MRGGIARGLEPIPLFTDTGCRTGHCAARRQATLRFVFQTEQDYSGRDAPWRRCCCGGGEPLGTAHAGLGPASRLLARSVPGDRLHVRGQERLRRAPTCTGGPEADQRVRSPRECVGLGGPEIPWPKGAPLSPARRSTVTTWSSYWSGWGQEGWRWHVLASSSCRYPTGSGPMPAVWCCGVTTAGRPPSYIYLGKCLAGCCYLSFSAPVGINSTWLKPFVSEVGPVDRFSNLGKFRATWSQFRGVACL